MFLFIIEVLGTIAFAISGIRWAAAAKFDWFGAYTVGLVTAIGGGTLRDVLLDIPVFWMQTWWYLAVTGLSLAFVIIYRKHLLVRHSGTLFIFDTIGLALFVVIGIQKTLLTGYPMWVAIIMGTITGSCGGVLRDILISQPPLYFSKDIYATACIAGGLVYWLIEWLWNEPIVAQSACAVAIIVLRVLAVKYSLRLPVLVGDTSIVTPKNRNTVNTEE